MADEVEWAVSESSPVSGTYHSKAELMQKVVPPIPEKLAAELKPH